MDKIFGANLEFVREDDYVEYFIFPKLDLDKNEDNAVRKQLEETRTKCMSIVEKLTKERDYIWHKDEFELRVRTCSPQELLLNDESTTTTKEKAANITRKPSDQGMFAFKHISYVGTYICMYWAHYKFVHLYVLIS